MPRRLWFVLTALVALPVPAAAQIVVSLPSTTLTTTMTATVSEQARVSVPAGVLFTVGDIGASTEATAAAVTVDQIVLASAAKQIRVSVQADAASFTPPDIGAPTRAATAVSWNAASWTNATGTQGVLSSASYNTVATCTAGVSDCSTNDLVFTLAPNTNITTAGSHVLTVTWKIESL